MNNKQKIVIINYGMGNLRSVLNKFKRMDVECIITSTRQDILKADKLILPGVGHFKSGMRNLKELGLIDTLNTKVIDEKTPILGICLGAQLFVKHSEEGDCQGLGYIDAEVVKFKVSDTIKYKVPHMGWNSVNVNHSNELDGLIIDTDIMQLKKMDIEKLKGIENKRVSDKGDERHRELVNNQQFYFVHSYHIKCNNPSDIWLMTTYEYEFVSAIHRGNIYGTQFHPEKSHEVGYGLLKRFVKL